jgi:hypothetical protein
MITSIDAERIFGKIFKKARQTRNKKNVVLFINLDMIKARNENL